jgi:6-phosphogluconolactonase
MKTPILSSTIPSFFFCTLLLLTLASSFQASAEEKTRRVYMMLNQAQGNEIAVFERSQTGSLSLVQRVSTGGLGSGPGVLPPPLPLGPGPDGLESQDSLVMTKDGRFLLAVNARSDNVSVLKITSDGLRLASITSAGGSFPVSIAEHENLVYVVNGGQDPNDPMGKIGNITGFTLSSNGQLTEIPNSTRIVGRENAGASDAVFSPDGHILIVTEMFADLIDIFDIDHHGFATKRATVRSNRPTPIAATFGSSHVLAITEINTTLIGGRRVGAVNAGSVSSYRLTHDGDLVPVSKGINTNQTGTCWIRFTPDGRFAFVVDSGSATISSLSVSHNGELTLIGATDTGGAFVSGPLDLSITADGRFLYLVDALLGSIHGFRIHQDGSLTQVVDVNGFPVSIQGIVAD